MKASGAVLFEVGKKLEIVELDVQPPKAGEVLLRMAAGGVCHSDLHVMTGHLAAATPAVLGHEGRASHSVDASAGDPVAQVRELTGGTGVDYAFEVVGLPRTMGQAYDCLAKRGMAVIVGVAPMTEEIAVPIMVTTRASTCSVGR